MPLAASDSLANRVTSRQWCLASKRCETPRLRVGYPTKFVETFASKSWVSERLQSSLTLVLVPSLSLVRQNLAEWGRHSTQDFDTLVICSDESVVQRNEDTALQSTADLGVKVTTKPAEIRQFLAQHRKRPAVVFATYQSSDRIAAAYREGEAWESLALAASPTKPARREPCPPVNRNRLIW